MNKLSFEDWSRSLETVWSLKTEQDCLLFADLMEMLDGDEEIAFCRKLLETVKLKHDHGVYESSYNALWRFPSADVGRLLANELPSFQKRMGKYDQVFRFYLPIEKNTEARNAFISEAKKWTNSEKTTAINAIKKWIIEIEAWENIFVQLGGTIKPQEESVIPTTWCDEWKKRLNNAKQKGMNSLFWKGNKNQWLEDLDFLLEVLALNLGKNWREIDTITNQLWGYAQKIAFAPFIEKLKLLPKAQQQKILANIKRVNLRKYKTLIKELNESTT